MAIDITRARKLLSRAELALVEQSLALTAVAPAAVRRKLARVRRLRDKFTDQGKRQQRIGRGKQPARSRRPLRGREAIAGKADVFAAVVQHLERLLDEPAARSRTGKAGSQGRRTGTKRAEAKRAGRRRVAGPEPDDVPAPVAAPAAQRAVKRREQQAAASTRRAGASGSKSGGKTGRRTTTKPVAPAAAQRAAGNSRRVHGHQAARNRQRQAKRDKR